MVTTLPTFRIDPAFFDTRVETGMQEALNKMHAAKNAWLVTSIEKLRAAGCEALAIEEHPTKTVITNNGQPMAAFTVSFIPDMMPRS